jgi:hypothetical protein
MGMGQRPVSRGKPHPIPCLSEPIQAPLRGAARSQCRSWSWRGSTCATARQTSSASVISGGRPGPDRAKPSGGMMRSVSST